MPYGQEPHHLRFSAEGGVCIDYDQSENTISINCNTSFRDVVQTINDPDIVENLGGGEYILNANLEVADDVTFEMTSNGDGLQSDIIPFLHPRYTRDVSFITSRGCFLHYWLFGTVPLKLLHTFDT